MTVWPVLLLHSFLGAHFSVIKGQTLRALVEGPDAGGVSAVLGGQQPVEHLLEEDLARLQQSKAALLGKLDEPMSGLGFVEQPVSTLNFMRLGQVMWRLPDDSNPFRLHWHSRRQQVMAQGSYPVDGNQVSQLVQHISQVTQQYDVSPSDIHIHINSGSHGDQVGRHAQPGNHETAALAEPRFLQEDMATALFATAAKVTVLDLARHARAAPPSALVVIDAYCYSGRGLHSAEQVGDTRLLWNVDLIKYRDKMPHPDSPVWDGDVDKKSHLSTASAWAWWNTADKAWIVTDVHTGAMSFVGESGFEVTKGPLKGRLEPGDVVYFGDVFSYQWQDMPAEESCVTIVKEPHFMSGFQLGFAKGVHSLLEAVFGEGAFDRAIAAAINMENSAEKVHERLLSSLDEL